MPKQRRAIERRSALIESAALVFERDGFAESSLTDIARQADSTTGAIYFYFPAGKHSFALAVIEEQKRRTLEALHSELTSDAGFAGVVRASLGVVDLLLADPVIRAGIRLTLEQNSLATDTARFYREWIEALELTYEGAGRKGELAEGFTPRAMSRATLSYFTGMHLLSEIVDDWSGLYDDALNMWRVLIGAGASEEHRATLLETASKLFQPPQPPLNRRSLPARMKDPSAQPA
jgi:AcrR family transcriptional regulator